MAAAANANLSSAFVLWSALFLSICEAAPYTIHLQPGRGVGMMAVLYGFCITNTVSLHKYKSSHQTEAITTSPKPGDWYSIILSVCSGEVKTPEGFMGSPSHLIFSLASWESIFLGNPVPPLTTWRVYWCTAYSHSEEVTIHSQSPSLPECTGICTESYAVFLFFLSCFSHRSK